MSKRGGKPKSSGIVTAPRWEDAQDVGNPDKLLLCPYDPHHLIRASRFPYHLIKCGKNHPELIDTFVTCPFNARHLMTKSELSDHISTCVYQSSISESYVCKVGNDKVDDKFHVPVKTWTAPICDEDWDEEVNKHGAAEPSFAFELPKPLLQHREYPSVSSSVVAGLRVPRFLPWTTNFGEL